MQESITRETDAAPAAQFRAVDYVRMSTKHQHYSAENQDTSVKRLRGHRSAGDVSRPKGIICARVRPYTAAELIERLRALNDRRSSLSGLIINETHGLPSSTVYAYQFGSFTRAYQMVGFTPTTFCG